MGKAFSWSLGNFLSVITELRKIIGKNYKNIYVCSLSLSSIKRECSNMLGGSVYGCDL